MKRRLLSSVALAAGLWLGGAQAKTFYWSGTAADDITDLSKYATNQWGKAIRPEALPRPGDTVYLQENSSYRVTDDTVAFASALNEIQPRTTCTTILDVSTNCDFGCGIHLWGSSAVIKRGKGTMRLLADRNIDTQGRHYAYNEPMSVEEGSLILPQTGTDREKNYVYASFAVAEGATLALPNAKNIYVSGGISGGGRIDYLNETEHGILYCGGKASNPPFRGMITGFLEFRPNGAYIAMLTEKNSFTKGVYLHNGSTFAVRFFGNADGTPSAFGTSTSRATVNGAKVGFLCIATAADGPQTTKRDIWDWYSENGIWTFDAGAYGGVTFQGSWRAHFGSSGARMKELILTGSNTAECVVETSVTESSAGYWGHYYLTKRGTGTWRMSATGAKSRDRLAGIGVENGTLRFDSLAERGKASSLGTATNLFGYAYQGLLSAAPPQVDYAIRLGTATDLAAEGVLEYTGSSDVSVATRPLAVTGRGRLRNATGRNFSLTGLRSIVPPEGGEMPERSTLTLDGDDPSAANVLRDLTEDAGAPPLDLVKEGAGAWTLSGDVAFTGAVTVRGGELAIVGEPGGRVLAAGIPSLAVASGAAFRVTGAEPEVRELAVDAGTGPGAVCGVRFAQKGTIVLSNTATARDVTFPWATDGSTGLANLAGWTVRTATDDGFEYDVTVGAGSLRIVRRCVVLEPGRVEVVAPRKAYGPTVLAVQEMTNYLSRILGAPVPWSYQPTAGKVSVVLGSNEWSRAAGIDVHALPRDGFIVKAVPPDRVYIAGNDANYSLYRNIPATFSGSPRYEHATVMGVYDFLERSADARFFFPGEDGTLLSPRPFLEVPEGERSDAPDYPVRSYYYVSSDAGTYDPSLTPRVIYNLGWQYNRLESINLPCCHGTRQFKYLERFGATHPEYFALKKDGTRHMGYDGSSSSEDGHLCWSSGITNEIFRDARSYLLGEDASVRGIPSSTLGKYAWGRNCQEGLYVDIMPNDSYPDCQCAACQANKAAAPYYATKIIWQATAGIAQRLLDEHVPGYVTQMVYSPYKGVPDFDLPTNILVMVAERGPFSKYDPESAAAQKAEIVAWTKKLGHKVWLWNYENKHSTLDLPHIPAMCPRAWGEYYKEMAPYTIGAFAESETDSWFFNHLNYYVFGKVAWDNGADVDAIIRDYHVRMYGAAAAETESFFDDLEEMWLRKVAARSVETPEGPITRPPSVHTIWTEVYTTNEIARWEALLDSAAAKLSAGSPEARRLALMRREMLTPMATACRRYLRDSSVERELARRAAHPEEISVISNGDFEDLPRPKRTERFYNGWYSDKPPFPLCTTDVVTGDACVTVTGATDAVSITQYLPDLKPSTRYRLSFFIKTDDVQCSSVTGGAGITLFDAYNHSFPENMSYTGTMGWTHCAFEFTTDPETNLRINPSTCTPYRSYIRLRMSANSSGKAYFDGVRLTEVSDVPKGFSITIR